MPTSEELAYCAGLFDGEGCIILQKYDTSKWRGVGSRGRRIRYSLFIQIKQVRPEPLRFLQSVLGGNLGFTPRHGRSSHYAGEWTWYAHSGGASSILTAMRPYLRLKVVEADVAIRFQSMKLRRDGSRSFKLGITDEEFAYRESVFQELQRLKRLHNDPDRQAEYKATPKLSLPIHV